VKNVFIVIALLLFSVSVFSQQVDKVIPCHVKSVPFSDFCKSIAEQTAVKIYYQKKWINDLKVSIERDSITVMEAVTEALKGTGLGASEWHGNIVVMPGEKLIPSMPDYNFIENNNIVIEEGSELKTKIEEQYLTGRKGDVPQTIRIGQKNGTISGSRAKITGRILDEESGDPLFNATIFIDETKTGAVSDINGVVSLTLKKGIYNAIFDYLGYAKKKYQIEVLSDGNFIISMTKSVIQMQEVVVYGDRQMSISAKDPGLDKISMKTIKELPMMMGERDILKVSATLPGIVSIGEGASGLNVRGGGSDQNAFYINKIPIYNTAHLFGFFPAFNSDIIKDFSIYKGHIPAQYGGHLSSVFNIITRQGNRKHLTARGGISPISANLVIEGPLKKDTCSFMLSARSSYSDWILKKVKDFDISNSSAQFNDFSGGINYDIQKTQLSAFAYYSYDHFRLSDINSYEYGNKGISTSIGHNFSNSFRSEFSVVASQYNFSTTDQQEVSSAYEHAYKMEHYEAKLDFKHILSEKNSLEYGLSSILYKLDRGKVLPYGDDSDRKIADLGTEQGLESAVYLSDIYDVFPWLNLTAGIRYALYMPMGPETVYLYQPESPVDVRNITDTLTYGANEPVKKYNEPDLRIAVNIKTDEAGSVKLAFNQMHQNLFMLNTTTAIAPNTQWKLADYHLTPSTSNQYSAGVFRTLANLGIETSAEVFYKQTRNFPEFKDGADFLTNPQVETVILQGDQKAWGIELYLKRSYRKVDGWISYSYSRSFVKVDGGEEWDQINEGIAYPSNFDIPNVLNVVLNYHLTKRVTFASIFTYQTGKPVTYPVSVYYVNGLPVLDYSKRNEYRIPDYVRADFSLTIEGNLRKNKPLHSSLIFSLYNAFGRENPYSVYYKVENGNIRSYQYSVIGVPIFTVTWLFKLGNYASE
jgi:hypothetical protein